MTARWPPDGLVRAVRDAAKGSGWTAWSGTLSRVDDGMAYHVSEFAQHIRFYAKPAAWDDWVWRLLEVETARRRSPSAHFRGVHARVPAVARCAVTARAPADIAAEILAFGEAELQRAEPDRLGDFPDLLRRDVDRTGRDDFAVTEVVWHLAEGRPGAARDIAEAVAGGTRRPSFLVHATRDGAPFSFFEAVLAETARAGG